MWTLKTILAEDADLEASLSTSEIVPHELATRVRSFSNRVVEEAPYQMDEGDLKWALRALEKWNAILLAQGHEGLNDRIQRLIEKVTVLEPRAPANLQDLSLISSTLARTAEVLTSTAARQSETTVQLEALVGYVRKMVSMDPTEIRTALSNACGRRFSQPGQYVEDVFCASLDE